jgi:hypothetical protein
VTTLQLDDRGPIFIGFKLDSQLRRLLESISATDRQYVSTGESGFLRICRLGEDEYVGKVVHDRLTTDRVNDVRRNVLSILRRLCPDSRLPEHMEILPCRAGDDSHEPAATG